LRGTMGKPRLHFRSILAAAGRSGGTLVSAAWAHALRTLTVSREGFGQGAEGPEGGWGGGDVGGGDVGGVDVGGVDVACSSNDGGGSPRLDGGSMVEGGTKQSMAVGLGGSSAGSWISERRRFSMV
jgi:hypothetical protein